MEEHALVVDSMLRSSETKHVFEYMRTLLGFYGEKPELQNSFSTVLMSHLESLVKVDSGMTADFVLDYYWKERLTFMNCLKNAPGIQYAYLSALIKQKETLERKGEQVLGETHAQYLTLLCEYAPKDVPKYLVENPNDYPLDLALSLVQEHGLLEAEAYVQERRGNVEAALEFHLKALDTRLNALLDLSEHGDGQALSIALEEKRETATVELERVKSHVMKQSEVQELLPDIQEVKDVVSAMENALGLCTRKEREEPEHYSNLWFSVLDKVAQYVNEVLNVD